MQAILDHAIDHINCIDSFGSIESIDIIDGISVYKFATLQSLNGNFQIFDL